MKKFDPTSFFPYSPIIDRPPVKWPNGARVAVWVIPNIEHFHLDLFNPAAPDIRNYSRRDYGNRVGIWRMINVLEKHGIKGTVALNGEVAKHYPRIMEEVGGLGWELMGHGMTNSIHLEGLSVEEERSVIQQTKAAIEGVGQSMKGWLGPGLGETWSSLDLLREAGVEYVCDWVNDDLPYRMSNGIYSIPYSIEINDMPLFRTSSISPAEFETFIRDAFDTLYEEGAAGGRVLGIALHPFLMGAAHRIKYLDNALGYIASHSDVWLTTGSSIIEAFKAQE